MMAPIPQKLVLVLMVGLALMGGGCASLSPSASNEPTWQEDMGMSHPNDKAAPDNWLLDLIGVGLEFGGASLAAQR
jgi:hypothetical protein